MQNATCVSNIETTIYNISVNYTDYHSIKHTQQLPYQDRYCKIEPFRNKSLSHLLDNSKVTTQDTLPTDWSRTENAGNTRFTHQIIKYWYCTDQDHIIENIFTMRIDYDGGFCPSWEDLLLAPIFFQIFESSAVIVLSIVPSNKLAEVYVSTVSE